MCLLNEEVQHILKKEIDMHSIADGSVLVQTSSQSVPSLPSWFGEVVLIAQCLRQHDVLSARASRVRFARRRFGQYEVIDFVAVLAGLCGKLRTHPGGFLRASASLCRRLHGALRTQAFARALHAQSLCGRPASKRRASCTSASLTSALCRLSTRGGSEGKSSAPGPRSCRLIPESRLGSFGGSGHG